MNTNTLMVESCQNRIIWKRLTKDWPNLNPFYCRYIFLIRSIKNFYKQTYMSLRRIKQSKTVISIIKGKITDDTCIGEEVFFTNLKLLTNPMLTAAKSDPYYGTRPKQLDWQVRNELSGHLILSMQDDLLIASNFFINAKELDGTAAVARQ